jgi:hypothetical protein
MSFKLFGGWLEEGAGNIGEGVAVKRELIMVQK